MEAHWFNKYFMNVYHVLDYQIPTMCLAALQMLGQPGRETVNKISNKYAILKGAKCYGGR